jgi:hypothetical protein
MELKEETSPAATKVEDSEDDNGTLYYRRHLTITDISNRKVHCC